MSFLENNFFLLAVTFGVFLLCQIASEKNGAGIAEPDFTHHCRSDYLP